MTKQERLQALERQVDRLQQRLNKLNAHSNTYSWLRLAIFLFGIALCIGVFFLFGWLAGLIVALIAVIAFSIVAFIHRKIERSITRHTLLMQINQTQIARIELDWERIPSTNLARHMVSILLKSISISPVSARFTNCSTRQSHTRVVRVYKHGCYRRAQTSKQS